MTELNVTATVDLKRATVKDANGAEMHNQHDPEVEHDNKQIFKDDTKYNLHFKLLNRDKLLQEQYGEMIEKRNENTAKQFNSGKISQTQYEERITSVDKYLNHEGKGAKKALTNYVFTLGNVDTEFKILDALKYDYIKQPVFDKTKKKITHYRPKLTDSKQRSQFLTLLGTAYLGVVSEINSRHSGLKVTNLWLHVDEGGMPHAQGTIVNMGHTASGKASYNLNRALAEFNGTKSKKVNGKVELTKFRETTDKYMIDMFNHRLKSMGLDKKLHLNFVRSGGEHGLSMKEYQENQNLKQAKSASQNAQETVRASYKQITGKEPINDEKQPLDVTECLHGIKAKLNQSEEAKEQAEKMVEEAKKKLSELQRQQQQEADRLKQLQVDAVTRRKNNDKLADENKKLKEKISKDGCKELGMLSVNLLKMV